MPVQPQNVSYMSPPVRHDSSYPRPYLTSFSTRDQFVPNVPISAAPIHPDATYSPQMPNISPRKSTQYCHSFSLSYNAFLDGSPFPQGYSSPQRSPMPPPPNGGSPQVYPYYQSSPSIPPPRYTPPEMMSPPVMMPPIMTNDQHPNQYPMNQPPHEQMSPCKSIMQ
jgi:hypothetical protein